MISLYGCGFIGTHFKYMYDSEVDVQGRDERVPAHKDILYFISTIHNYHVHDDLTRDVDTIYESCVKPLSTADRMISHSTLYHLGLYMEREHMPLHPKYRDATQQDFILLPKSVLKILSYLSLRLQG